jgi:hypothetical protein
MSSDTEAGPRDEAGLRFPGPKYFLTHLGLFGLETILIQKHGRPDRNAVLPGALLWDDEDKHQYFLFSSQLAPLEVPGEPGDARADAPDAAPLLQSGILFASPDYVLPRDRLGLFGQESILIKKHIWPDRNSVLPGAMLWDTRFPARGLARWL